MERENFPLKVLFLSFDLLSNLMVLNIGVDKAFHVCGPIVVFQVSFEELKFENFFFKNKLGKRQLVEK